MCRLLGQISIQPEKADRWLLDAEIPFLRQATIDPQQPQGDGWGIAWYAPATRTPRLEKGAEGVQHPLERHRFVTAAREAKGPLIIAHLRKASNPLHLPRQQLVAPENSQPFVSDGMIFAHNGWIPYPRETLPRLGARRVKVRGVNDSEVLEQLFLHRWDATGHDVVRAYSSTVAELRSVWEELGRPAGGPHGGLNLLFAPSARELWAFCYYAGEHGSCLSGLPRPYYEMSYREETGRVIVASEPSDRDLGRWRPLRSGEFLHVELSRGKLVATQGPVPDLPAAVAPGEEPVSPSTALPAE